MKILCSLLLVPAAVLTLASQNVVFSLKEGDSIPHVLTVNPKPDYYGNYNFNYRIGSVPSLVQSLLKTPNDPVAAANKTVSNFQVWHVKYGSGPNVARDFLDVSYYWCTPDPWPDEHDYREDSVRCSEMKQSIFSNRLLRETIYSWLMPSFKAAFSIMSIPEQQDYLHMLEEAREYAVNFDLAKERTLANDPTPGLFIERRGHHRAFIYRRIANNELSREECIEWIDRITADFSSVLRKNPREEDQYVLTNDLGNGYYAAVKYYEANSYRTTLRIARPQNGQYTLLRGVEFLTDRYSFSNFITGVDLSKRTRPRSCYFYCDSTGWTFAHTAYDGNPAAFIPKGTGRATRMIVVESIDRDYTDANDPNKTRALAKIIDVHSGKVLFDSVFIDVRTEPREWSMAYFFPAREEQHTIFQDARTGLYGAIGSDGTIVLQPKYTSIEKTNDTDVLKVNGNKEVRAKRRKKP